MKNILLPLCASLSIIGTVAANDTFLDTAQLKKEIIDRFSQTLENPFELMDIDGNKKLSKNECRLPDTELAMLSPYLSEQDAAELKQKIEALFDKHDINKDSYIDEQESKAYFADFYSLIADSQIRKMDIDGDGKITDEDMETFIKTMPTMEESMAKLQEATAKLEEITKNPQEYTQQIMLNSQTAISNEEFLAMDTDKDGKATAAEYAEYMFNHPNNKDIGFSKDDYLEIFQEIDNTQKGFVTIDEYTAYQKKQFDEVMQMLNKNN